MNNTDIPPPNNVAGESWLDRFNRNKTATLILFVATGLIFYLMNFWTPYSGPDDYAFNFVSGTNYEQRVETVGDLFVSWKTHYLHGNGRFADDGCVRPTHFLGKPVFNVLNTLVFLAFLGLILRHVAIEKTRNASLIFALALFGFLMPSPQMSCFWQTGACNYLWAATAAIFWLWLLKKSQRGDFSSRGNVFLVPLFFVSIICGWFHEGISPVVSLCAGILALVRFRRRELSRAEVFLLAGYFIGTALVCFSPGIINRALNGVSYMKLPPLTLSAFVMGALKVLFWSKISLALGVALGIGLLLKQKREKAFVFVRGNAFLFAILLVALAYNIILLRGAGGERNCFFHEAIAMILALKLLSAWISTRGNAGKIALAVAGAGTLAGLAVLLPEMIKNKKVHDDFVREISNSSSPFVAATLPQSPPAFPRFMVQLSAGTVNFNSNLAVSHYYGRRERVFVAPQWFFDKFLNAEKDEFCVPANEFCPGWYTAPELSFALKKIETPEDDAPIANKQVKYVKRSYPSGFVQKTIFPVIAKFSGRGAEFEVALDGQSVPRKIETPHGKYWMLPVVPRLGVEKGHLIPVKDVAIKIVKDAEE